MGRRCSPDRPVKRYPLSGDLFAFRYRRRHPVSVLYGDGQGFGLFASRPGIYPILRSSPA